MKCPFCQAQDTKVIDSRPADDNSSIKRRRQCESCNKRFTTYEKLETIPLMVIKKDGKRQPFDRTKLEKGIERALEKRPVSTADLENIVTDIENKAVMKGKGAREISTQELGNLVLETLHKIDKVAYIRFASVYRHFENLEEFITEVNKLGGRK